MNKIKIEEKFKNSGDIVEKDHKGRYLKGHKKVGGKKKGFVSLTAIIKKKLSEMGPDQKRSFAEWMADNIIQDALDGDTRKITLIWNYLEGMPKSKTDIDLTTGGQSFMPSPEEREKANKLLKEIK
ncbi:MAG: hypothetical protein U9O94_05245 [Nanoarchaeota archaeon]|nr:hypothetical protein [Nanoarchaeota archaeon]